MALSSVIDSAGAFGEVHIVSTALSAATATELYRAELKLLRDTHGMTIRFHCSDDESAGMLDDGATADNWLRSVASHIIVRIPPCCYTAPAAMNTLLARVDEQWKTRQRQHAIMPVFQFVPLERKRRSRNRADAGVNVYASVTDNFPSVWLGFFMLLYLIDYWRWFISGYTIHDPAQHVCAQEVLHGHDRVFLEPAPRWQWPWQTCIQSPLIFLPIPGWAARKPFSCKWRADA
jgi:hypothetical protein